MRPDNPMELYGPLRVLVAIGLILLAWLVFFFGMASDALPLIGLMVLVPFAFLLANRPDVMMLSVIVLMYASITIPALPQGIMLSHVVAFAFVCLMIARTAIQKTAPKRMLRPFLFFSSAYVVVVLFTMYVRGFGLRFMNDEMWGGAAYLRLFISFGFMLLSEHMVVQESTWKRFLWLVLFAALVPVTAHLVLLVSHGTVYWQYYFVRNEAWALSGSLMATVTGTGIVRYYFLAPLAQALYMMFLTVLPWWTIGIGVLSSTTLYFLSGFRSSSIFLFMVSFFYALFYKKEKRIRRAFVIIVCGMIAIAAMAPFTRKMPLSVQRCLSVIPFYDIEYEARRDAEYSTKWRLDIWKIMLSNIPKYFWVGSGVAVNQRDIYSSNPYFSAMPEGAYAYHNYHNGPLGVLHDFGIFGLISVLGLLATSGWGFIRYAKLFSGGTFLHRYYTFLLATYVQQIFVFLIIFGDVYDSVSGMFISAVLLRGVIKTRQAQIEAESAEDKPVPEPEPPIRRAAIPFS